VHENAEEVAAFNDTENGVGLRFKVRVRVRIKGEG